MKKKFVLEFDEEPALIFVQHKTGDIGNAGLYQDGKEMKGVRSIKIDGAIDSFTTHEVDYITGCTEGGE